MAKFFFDVGEDGTFVPDHDGEAFKSVDAVLTEAVAAATALAQERLPGSNLQTVVVEARDEHGSRVLTATMSLKIDLVKAYVMPRGKGNAADESTGRSH